jgi:RNA polymerase sigma-70 factor (ECF subfamily)
VDREETTLLLRQARDGSREALDRLLGHCAPRLLAVIRLRLGRELREQLESRDILQDCLLAAFEHLEQLDGTDGRSLMAWLSRIAENEIRDQVDYHRRQRRDVRRAVPLEDGEASIVERVRSASSQVVLDEQWRHLERALETLPAHQREVIVLRKLEELGWSEIAARLGKSEDACRMALARAMTALTLALETPP